MRSSTSSFNAVALFTMTLGFLLALSWAIPRELSTPLGKLRDARSFAEYSPLGQKGIEDYARVYYGLPPTIDALRSADVIVLGTSRMLYAMRKDLIGDYFKRRGLRYFTLGFGWEEPLDFSLEVIKKFDLRPKYIIVDVSHYFRSGKTGSDQLLKYDRFELAKALIEEELGRLKDETLSRILPIRAELGLTYRRAVYRSRLDGTWRTPDVTATDKVFHASDFSEPGPGPGEIELAKDFARAMKAQGTQLILIHIPGPKVSLKSSLEIARAMGSPLHSPDVGTLGSFDAQHLGRESATKFTTALLNELEPRW